MANHKELDINSELFSSFVAEVTAASERAFNAFLTYLPGKLLDYSQKPGVMNDAIIFLHAKSLLVANAESVLGTFNQEVSKAMLSYSPQLTGPGGSDYNWREDNLSLVSFDDMEEEVALTSAAHKADAINTKLLWALGKRFSLLIGGKLLPEQTLPVAPLVYCQALRKALSGLDLPVQSRMVIYKLFEKKFLGEIKDLYERLNQHLIDAGFLPHLHYAIQNPESNSNRPLREMPLGSALMAELTARGPGGHQPGGGAGGGQPGGAGGSQGGTGGGAAGNGQLDEEAEYNIDQLMLAAKRLQTHSAKQLSEDVPAASIRPVDIAAAKVELVTQLQSIAGPEQKARLSDDDMKTIELVGMLFEYMLDDEHLPDVVKTLLSHLHTPFIKVALADRDFFDREEHPARLLMDSLAEAGVKWVGNDGKSQYGILESIRDAVTRAVKEYEEDPKLFAKLLMEFSSYIKKVDIKVQMLEKRAAEKARGEDRLKRVKQRVNREIKQRIRDVELPSAILLLLLQPWSDYLAFLLLRYGDKSDNWVQAINLIDDLIWGLELENSPENRMLWRQNYPWVESTILKGFETIGYDPGKADKLKRAVDKVYQFSYKKERSATPEQLKNKLIRLADEKVGEALQVSDLGEGEKRVIDELTALPFGAWFEYSNGSREKLAWFNRDSLQFLFVDQAGRRTGMRDGASLARQILSGELRVVAIEDQPLVERTLESIYSDLSRRQSATHG